MDAALELIWAQSYGAVTIDDICKRAEVKKGSFYYFFDSKEQLAVAALERMWNESWKPRMDEIFSASLQPLDRLKAYLAGIHRWQSETQQKFGRMIGCPVASVGSEVGTTECTICDKTREVVARKRRYVESTIREAIAEGALEPGDPVKRTTVLLSFIDGMTLQARMANDLDILKSLPELGLEILRVKEPAAELAAPPVPAL